MCFHASKLFLHGSSSTKSAPLFRKKYSFLVSLKIPKYKIPHNSTNRWRQKKGKTRLTLITANCLGCARICQLFPLKISVVSLYKLRQYIAQYTQNKNKNLLPHSLCFCYIFWALMWVQGFGLWVHTTKACRWILGGDRRSQTASRIITSSGAKSLLMTVG